MLDFEGEIVVFHLIIIRWKNADLPKGSVFTSAYEDACVDCNSLLDDNKMRQKKQKKKTPKYRTNADKYGVLCWRPWEDSNSRPVA